jgi:hypothetical protein
VNAPAPLGILGTFDTPAAMLDAARRLREFGFEAVDGYTPYPVEGLGGLTRPQRKPLLPLAVALGGAIGGAIGYFVQYWDEVLSYPINVGGRPYHSWPAFIVSAFEIALLSAVTAGFFGLWLACRLPRLHHPIFAADAFERASRDRFVLCVEASDPGFEAGAIRSILERCGAAEIAEVAA